MLFSFWLGNHIKVGQRSLEDVIGIIGHQLRALGHGAVWDTNNDKFIQRNRGYNVVVEGFWPGAIQALAEGYAQGARFICIATEEPTPKGFNWGTQKEMVYRQEMFPLAAPYLDGILHLVPGKAITEWFSQFAPSSYAELGYAPSLVRGHIQPNGSIKLIYPEPDYEFGFFGSLTPRRERLLKRLAKQMINKPKAIRVMADFGSQIDRDRQMSRAKVILQIRKFEAMGLVSSSRCCTALCLGRPVVAEPHDLSEEWSDIVRFSRSVDEFISEALFIRAAWQGVHATQFDRFKKKMTPERCIGEPLARIGVLGQRAAA